MAIDTTEYDITFKAPVLPPASTEYSKQNFDSLNNVLRLYFNQLDQALRSNKIINQAEATTWFMS